MPLRNTRKLFHVEQFAAGIKLFHVKQFNPGTSINRVSQSKAE